MKKIQIIINTKGDINTINTVDDRSDEMIEWYRKSLMDAGKDSKASIPTDDGVVIIGYEILNNSIITIK